MLYLVYFLYPGIIGYHLMTEQSPKGTNWTGRESRRLGQKEKDAMLEKTLRENAELKNAVKNRPAGSPVGAPGDGGPKVPDQIISPELMNYFKNVLKWDDEKVELYRTNYKAQYGR